MLRIRDKTARGNVVALVPPDAGPTTRQAADILNVGPPHLISLVEAGRVPRDKVCDALRRERQRWRRPSATLDEFLAAMERRDLPSAAALPASTDFLLSEQPSFFVA